MMNALLTTLLELATLLVLSAFLGSVLFWSYFFSYGF